MFYYVKGELVMTDPQSAVVDCGGVGYKLTVSMNTLSHLTETGKKVCLYTHLSVREDAVVCSLRHCAMNAPTFCVSTIVCTPLYVFLALFIL